MYMYISACDYQKLATNAIAHNKHIHVHVYIYIQCHVITMWLSFSPSTNTPTVMIASSRTPELEPDVLDWNMTSSASMTVGAIFRASSRLTLRTRLWSVAHMRDSRSARCCLSAPVTCDYSRRYAQKGTLVYRQAQLNELTHTTHEHVQCIYTHMYMYM